MPNPISIVFEGKTGSVSGSDLNFIQFGKSTLIGIGMNNGMETVEIYQIDRINGKVLYTKTRVGTKNVTELLCDVSMLFIGDAKRLPN